MEETPQSHATIDPFIDDLAMQAADRARRVIVKPAEDLAQLSPKPEDHPATRGNRVTGLAIAGGLAIGLAATVVAGANTVAETVGELNNPHNHENMRVLDSTSVTPSLEDGSLISGVQGGVELLIRENGLNEGAISNEDVVSRANLATSEYKALYGEGVQQGTPFTVELLTSIDNNGTYSIDVLPPKK
jgi:hypothetical protein